MVCGPCAGGNRLRTSGTVEDAGLVADLYTHNASRRIPQKGVRIRQSLACAALRRVRVEHFQGAAAGVDLIAMGEIWGAFENAEQVLIP